MNNRFMSIFHLYSIAGILICILLFGLHIHPALAQDPLPTPTYDPFAQPELPPKPTDLEMGRYLFWRHCMPCHGDVGQGLTDEFRALWGDHANCWGRGCHGGKGLDEGFPIPTIVPSIVTEDQLVQFTSEEDLFDFLKATHPPQYPGYLEDEEYHNIATILFKMNNRQPGENAITPTALPLPTSTPAPISSPTPTAIQSFNETASSSRILIITCLGAVFLAAIIYGRRALRARSEIQVDHE